MNDVVELAPHDVFAAREAEHSQKGLVAERRRPSAVYGVEGFRGGIDEETGEGLALLERLSRALSLRDVAVEQRQAVRGRVGSDVEPRFMAVWPDVSVLDIEGLALGHGPFVKPSELTVFSAGPSLPMRETKDRLTRPGFEAHSLGIDLDHSKVSVEQHEGFGDRIENAA